MFISSGIKLEVGRIYRYTDEDVKGFALYDEKMTCIEFTFFVIREATRYEYVRECREMGVTPTQGIYYLISVD